jgi:hypothetical protein
LSLLSVAAQVYGRGWNRLSAFQKVQLLLFGEPNLSVDDNIEIFKNVIRTFSANLVEILQLFQLRVVISIYSFLVLFKKNM